MRAARADEPAEASAPLIESIDFEGLRRVEADAVRVVVASRPGRPINPSAVSDDLKAIYAMGYFEDVRASKEPTPGGVRLVFEVVEKPAIRKVDIRGNDDVSNDDIKNVVDIRAFTILNEAKVKRNQQKIRELYAEKGYYLAEIDAKIEPAGANEVNVVFDIKEKAKVKVRSIRIVGNEHLSDGLLKSGLATREGTILSFLNDSGTYRPEAFQVDLLRISSQYYDRGYINVKIDPPDVEISPDKKDLFITIRVEEGEQFSVGRVDFDGDILTTKDELFELAKTSSGAIFNRSQLGQDLLALKTRYEDDGYAYANITPATNIDAKKRTIDITFEIEKGQKVYYERINVVGNTKTRDKVVRRELRIFEGDLTSASLRELSKRRVTALGYFEKVEIKTRKGSADDLQIVDVEIKEKATGTFQIGAGFSSAENFIATAQVSQENFLGRGQSVSLSAQISSLRQLFQLQFTEPYFFDTDWTFSMDAFNTETQFRSFLRSSTGGELTLGHPITDEIRTFLTYSLEFVESKGADAALTQPAFAALNNKGRISSLKGTLSYDTRDNRLFPTDGMFHSASMEVSNKLLGASDTRQFQRYRWISRLYRPLIGSFVGKLAARFGYIHSDSELGLSPSENFIQGGINSVRGYAPFTIGPDRRGTRNDRGLELLDPASDTFVFVEGGNKEALFNAEIEFPIFEEVGIRGVVFLDAGNTYGTEENFFYLGNKVREQQSPAVVGTELEFDSTSLPLGMFWSVGFGFRWFSPIGPLRFEWGIPLTRRPTDDKGPLFEFSIGNAF
ncbi:MAG: outer membrane protein assembly factor BamA [Deltaproteobacteria bacterium]|nr:outer membrane protein assembly factor BamA [Deltaproteobacteria bacterium]